MSPRRGRRVVRAFAALAGLACLLPVALLSALAIEHSTSVALPSPTGPDAVGRVISHWTNTETASTSPEGEHEVMAWIWYPADRSFRERPAEYLPARMRGALREGVPFFLRLLARDPSKVRVHSTTEAAVSPEKARYPVVLLRGGGSLEVSHYTALAEDLASHGYFVVGLDAPGRTFAVALPDGRVVRRVPESNPENCLGLPGLEEARCAERIMGAWIGDMRFALSRLEALDAQDPSGRFTSRLDLGRVGAVGHSFGGATALEFCREDPRCRAGVDIDGAPVGPVVQEGLDRPVLFLLGDHRHEPEDEKRRVLGDIHAIYDRLPKDGRALLGLRGANHSLFSDDGVLRSHLVLGSLRAFGVLGLDGERQLELTAGCVSRFLDAHLKGLPPPSLEAPKPRDPEIEPLG